MGDAALTDAAFRERDYRQQHAEMVNMRVQQFAARFERWALTETLQARGIPAAPLSTVADLGANVEYVWSDWNPENEVWARIARTGSGVTTTTGGRTVSSPPQPASADGRRSPPGRR